MPVTGALVFHKHSLFVNGLSPHLTEYGLCINDQIKLYLRSPGFYVSAV